MDAQLSRDEETGIAVESEQEVPLALPESITVTRRSFEAHMRGYAFKSWGELVRAQPGGMAPQGVSLTSVKCDPMQVFGFIATMLLQLCIWGLIGYFASADVRWSAAVGAVLTSAYGIVLWFCIGLVPRQMAGMLWPNIPAVVGAVGLQAVLTFGDFEDFAAAKVLFCVSIPSSVAAALLMRKLPEDPDRAALVTNLFAGLWLGTTAICSMLGDGDAPDGYGESYWGGSGSLVVLGAAAIGIAAALCNSSGRWGSVELVTWTMNVGSLAVLLGTVFMLWGVPSAYEPLCWLTFSAVSAALAALGLKFNRTFPVLLSAVGLFAVCVRTSFAAMSITDGNFVVGMCTFGALGIAVVVVAHRLLGRNDNPTSARDNLF